MEEEQSVINVVKKTEPAVVSVIITKEVPVYERSPQSSYADPFSSLFDQQYAQRKPAGTQKREIGGGTAFFISPDGLLLTNKHVVNDAKAEYAIFLNDGRTLTATVAARDPLNDIALLKVNGKDFPFIAISKDEPALGQTAIAIGNALAEFRNTVSKGVISGLGRSITAGDPYAGQMEELSRIIQTDAAINQGNSGGPLLNLRGEVLGMNTAVAGSAQNIAFAIPAEDLIRVLDSYRTYGRIVHPYIGVRYVLITKALQEKNTLAYDYGALVIAGQEGDPAVLPGSPAAKAGLKENDIILEVDGIKLTEDTSLQALVLQKNPGDTMNLKIARQGREEMIAVKLEERND